MFRQALCPLDRVQSEDYIFQICMHNYTNAGNTIIIIMSQLQSCTWISRSLCPEFLEHAWRPILLWYSRSVHPEKWHALYNVNACENYYPGKWQAMHDANACENYIAIILRWQSPCFQMYANTSVYCNTVALLLFICHKNAIEKPREICMETGSTSSATKVIAIVYTWEGVTRGQLRPIDLKSSIIYYLDSLTAQSETERETKNDLNSFMKDQVSMRRHDLYQLA